MGKASLIIAIISAIVKLISSQYIVTSNNYASVIRKMEAFYQNALTNKIPQALKITPFESIKKAVDGKAIEISKVLFSEIDLDDNHPYIILERNLIAYSPNLYKVVFTFTYKIDSSNEVDALLYFTIYNLVIEEIEDKDKHAPNVKITIEDNESSYDIKSLDFEVLEVPEVITKAVVSYFPLLNFKVLQKAMSSAINNFFLEALSKQPSSVFYLSQSLGHLRITNDMTKFTGFCTDLGKERKTGQCYYSGNSTRFLDYNLKADAMSNPSFITEDKFFQIFVSNKLFQEIFNYVISLKVVLFLNEGTKPTKYPYQFIVSNLLPFFPSLARSFIGRYPFTIRSEYKSIQMLDRSTIKINYKHTVDIHESKEKVHQEVIQFEVELLFEFEIIAMVTNVNLCLARRKALTLTMSDNPSHKLEASHEFKMEYERLLSLYLKQEKVCLGKEEGINLDDYIKYIDFSEVNDKGVFLMGKQMFE